MLRILIIIVCYTLAVISLPRFAPFSALLNTLAQLPSKTALIINISALISSSALLYALTRKPGGLLYKRPSPGLFVLRMGLFGIVFAALYELFQAMSGYAISVQGLALIPPAFMIAEAVYFLCLWVWRRFKKVQGPMFAKVSEDQITTDNTKSAVPRLLITMPAYVFILVYLPQQQDYQNLEAKLVNISPSITLTVSALALVIGGAIMFKIARQNQNKAHPDEAEQKAEHLADVKNSIILAFCFGLGFAALFNLISYLLSYGPSLSSLLLIPFGFAFAEALYQGINWRVKYGPPEG